MSHRIEEPQLPRDALEALRRLPTVDPAARARLRTALERERRPRWILLPSPVRAAVAVGVLVTATSLAWLLGTTAGDGTAPPVATSAGVGDAAPGPLTPVQFVLVAPDARSVALAGDFNGWDPAASPLSPGEGGVWSIVVPLARGAFSYSFVIDGREWRADPGAALSSDDFGRPSSVLFVTPET